MGITTAGAAPLQARPVTRYLLMLINTAVFFIHWKKSLLQSPLVAGVKEQATTMKSDLAASSGVDTGGARGSIRCCARVRTAGT